MSHVRYLIASFTAPVGALTVPALLALSEFNAEARTLANGSLDDAATLGAALFLLVGLPIFYFLGCCYFAAIGHVLYRMRRLSLKSTLLCAGLIPWPVIALVSASFLTKASIFESLLFVGIAGTFTSFCTALGALVWWAIVKD